MGTVVRFPHFAPRRKAIFRTVLLTRSIGTYSAPTWNQACPAEIDRNSDQYQYCSHPIVALPIVSTRIDLGHLVDARIRLQPGFKA